MVLRRRQARALKHWIDQQLAAAYMRWAEHTAEIRRQRYVLSKALGRLAHRQLSGAFLRWAEHVAELQWQRRIVSKTVARMAQRQLAGAFGAWCEHAGALAEDSKRLHLMEIGRASCRERV